MTMKRSDPAQKRHLLQQLQAQGINDPMVLKAMNTVPREQFVASGDEDYAYENIPMGIGHGQTISQPYIVAQMTSELLGGKSLKKVLEIGTGSGYQGAILSTLVDEVYTVECVPELYEQATKRFKQYGYNNIHTKLGDGKLGWEAYSPYDGIMVTAATETVPTPLYEQLRDGGRLVIPVGRFGSQRLAVITREGDEYRSRYLEFVSFVPLV